MTQQKACLSQFAFQNKIEILYSLKVVKLVNLLLLRIWDVSVLGKLELILTMKDNLKYKPKRKSGTGP